MGRLCGLIQIADEHIHQRIHRAVSPVGGMHRELRLGQVELARHDARLRSLCVHLTPQAGLRAEVDPGG